MGLFCLGEVTARETEQGIAIHNPHQHRLLTFRSAEDPGMSCRAFAASALCLLGYPDQAINRSREACSLSQELAHPFSLAWALLHAAWLYQWRREAQVSQSWAEAGIALATEQGFAYWLAAGDCPAGLGAG